MPRRIMRTPSSIAAASNRSFTSRCYRGPRDGGHRMPESTCRSRCCTVVPTATVTGLGVGGPPFVTSVTVYVPGASASWKEPSEPVVVSCASPSVDVARTVPLQIPGGHGEPASSTGHVGPIVTRPSRPPAGGMACEPHETLKISIATIVGRRIRLRRRERARGFPRSVRVCSGLQRSDERQVAVLLRVVQAVADDELVGDVEAEVADVEVHLLDAFLAQERGDLERGGLASGEVPQQVFERQARVDDVLDDQDVEVAEVVIEVLEDAHDAGGLGGRAVGRDRHEVELQRQVDVPREIGHHDERALQDTDEEQAPVAVVDRDLRAHLGELRLDLGLGDEDRLDVVGEGIHARARVYPSMWSSVWSSVWPPWSARATTTCVRSREATRPSARSLRRPGRPRARSRIASIPALVHGAGASTLSAWYAPKRITRAATGSDSASRPAARNRISSPDSPAMSRYVRPVACHSSSRSRRSVSAVRAIDALTSRPVASSMNGNTSCRIEGRRYRRSSFIGSRRGRRCSAPQNASTSARVTSSSGWIQTLPWPPGSIPARPSMPVPRNRLIKTDSAWSSTVCASASDTAPISRRTSFAALTRTPRAHASTEAPFGGCSSACRIWSGTPSRSQTRPT